MGFVGFVGMVSGIKQIFVRQPVEHIIVTGFPGSDPGVEDFDVVFHH